MKTIKSIQKEMEEVISEIKDAERSSDKKSISQAKRLRLKLSKLKFFEKYLKTNPTDDYCKKEILRIEERINKIIVLYEPPESPERFTKSRLTAMKREFEKGWEVPKLRKQLSALYYILK